VFTGLVETVGKVAQIKSRGNYRILMIESAIDSGEIAVGESIACDGACLTVVDITSGSFVVEASQETVARTILAGYRVGSQVNLERSLKLGSRLGGHFVSGHVDDTGTVDCCRPAGESLELALMYNPVYDRLVIEKGSIAINGVSLTVNTCRSGWCSTNLVPHTVKSTNLGSLRSQERINLEFDMIGKYVARMLDKENKPGLTIEKFKESGW